MTANSASTDIATLDEAIVFLEFTRDDKGNYFYDAGYDDLWQADEETLRNEMHTILVHGITPHEESGDTDSDDYRKHQKSLVALQIILDDVLARPGYVPLAQQEVPQWKTEMREQEITTLDEALVELCAAEEKGVFFSDEDDFKGTVVYSQEYLEEELGRVKAGMPQSDELTFFYPYHYARLYVEAMEILLKEVKKRG